MITILIFYQQFWVSQEYSLDWEIICDIKFALQICIHFKVHCCGHLLGITLGVTWTWAFTPHPYLILNFYFSTSPITA